MKYRPLYIQDASRMSSNQNYYKKSVNAKNYCFVIFFATLSISNMSILYLWTKTAKGFKRPHITNDISCFSESDDDGLPYFDDALANKTQNIFFVETSCRKNLDFMQGCAVESATRAHPDWVIHLVFAGPVNSITLHTGVLEALQVANVRIARIRVDKAFNGTPLEPIPVENLIDKSIAKVAHVSDALRLFLLWKYGGVYMDLDVLVLKSFNSLATDFAARESSITMAVATGIMGLSRKLIGRKIAKELVEELGSTFEERSQFWPGTGPALITAVLTKFCGTKNVTLMNSKTCQGFEVYNSKVFYPVQSEDWPILFKAGDIDLNGSYAIHMWNKLISNFNVEITKFSVFAKLAQKYCPTVYKHFQKLSI